MTDIIRQNMRLPTKITINSEVWEQVKTRYYSASISVFGTIVAKSDGNFETVSGAINSAKENLREYIRKENWRV